MMKNRASLVELWDYRELFYFLIWRDIKVRYKQTLIGATWILIQPLFSMMVFTFFFGRLVKMPSDGVPYAIFSYTALVPWTYFTSSLSRSNNSLVSNSNLITKVYFPRVALVVSSTLSGLLDYALSSVVLFALLYIYKIELSFKILLWPVLTVILVLLALGLGMIFSSLNVKYRDIGYMVPYGLQLFFFITPILYPTSIIPEAYRDILGLNPMYGIVDGFRSAFLYSRQVNWQLILMSLIVALITLFIGIFCFNKTEREFADII
jgi:lipopolysaccharide transport system permease protein